MDDLKAIAGRLAAGATGRTEADVQSDVRKFVLDAPLDLGGNDLTEVLLEAQAGGGRRIDVEAGNAAIEVKKSLGSPTILAAAVAQLAGYVRQRTDELGQRYVGVLTDGKVWILHHLLLDDSLQEVSRLTLSGADDADRLAAWLEAVLATASQVTPTPAEIIAKLGATSPGYRLDLADLADLHRACRDDPEVRLKRELWNRLLVAALGVNFPATDELFVTHTYLVLTAELIAHAVAGVPLDAPQDDVRALLEGHQFNLAGLHGVVEADFFDWPAVHPEGGRVVRAIAKRLSRFDWTQVEHDVLKSLYESVIDADTRHKLGEYYTPDWLAEKMVAETIADPLNQRVLDPSCGSGTFLFWAIRRVLAAADEAGLSNREAIALVVANVHGIDLHPVAVTLARVTYLLAIGRDRLKERDALSVPVYLGDSVRWEQDITLFAQGGITIRTSDEMELVADELHFPEGTLEDPARFDRLVAALADKAASRPPVSLKEASKKAVKLPKITGILNMHLVAEEDREAVELVFEKLCRLHDAGRDHVWGYYVRNLARPLSFVRPERRADVLIGNPPWLAYRYMSAALQERYQALTKPRSLWAGGRSATQQDLSDLFVARAVEQYLRPDGRFAFVMPHSVLSRRQFEGFRSADWTSQGGGARAVTFTDPDDFKGVKPSLFPVPCCVVKGHRSTTPGPLPARARTWQGRVPRRHAAWREVTTDLNVSDETIHRVTDAIPMSPYLARFKNGATLFPTVLVRVEARSHGTFGGAAGTTPVVSARNSQEKQPWKAQPGLSGVVEDVFLHPMHSGSTIVAYRAQEPELVLVPWAEERLLEAGDDRLDEYPNFAVWWREADRLYRASQKDRTGAGKPRKKMTLSERVDFQRNLRRQFPIPEHRVVYSASGTHLAACRLEGDDAVLEHKLYWGAADSLDEARYLTAILNSQVLAAAVKPLQAYGDFGPRDFDTYVFALNFPIYDPTDEKQTQLVDLAARAERVAAAVDLDEVRPFTKARQVTRHALVDDGVAGLIDLAVAEVLAASAPPEVAAAITEAVD